MTPNPSKPPKLEVVLRERRRYIMVPTEWAGDLRIYLKTKGVMSSPPEEVVTGTVSIELARGADVTIVQGFLDGWRACA